MSYTEYKYPDDVIAQELAQKRTTIKANLGPDADLLKNGLKVITQRLVKDPMRYRDYGPYWWAIKDLLRSAGLSLGSHDSPLMKDFYKGKSPVETLVIAEMFRDDYLATQLRYNNQFILDASTGELIEIVDTDMENRQA